MIVKETIIQEVDHKIKRNIMEYYQRDAIPCGLDCCASKRRVYPQKSKKYLIPTIENLKYNKLIKYLVEKKNGVILTQSLLEKVKLIIGERNFNEIGEIIERDEIFIFMDKLMAGSTTDTDVFDRILSFYREHRPDLQFTTEDSEMFDVPVTYNYPEYEGDSERFVGTFYCDYYSNGYIKYKNDETGENSTFYVFGLLNVNRALWGDTVEFVEINKEEYLIEEQYDGINGYVDWLKFTPQSDSAEKDMKPVPDENSDQKFAQIISIKNRRYKTLIGNTVDIGRVYSNVENEKSEIPEFQLIKPIDKKYPPFIVNSKKNDKIMLKEFLIYDWPAHSKYPIGVSVDSNENQEKYSNEDFLLSLDSIENNLLKMNDLNRDSNKSLILNNRNEYEKINWEEIKFLYPQEIKNIVQDESLKNENQDLSEINPNRKDLTHLRIFSIDPPGCTDIDDCLSIEEMNVDEVSEFLCEKQKKSEGLKEAKKIKRTRPVETKGATITDALNATESVKDTVPDGEYYYKLGVHIADVSSFVPVDSVCSKEAFQRATTIYLNSKRIDMIPEMFSSELCSLRNNQLRLAMSVFMVIKVNKKEDSELESPILYDVLDVEITESLIKSCSSLTYAQADEILDLNDQVLKKSNDLTRQLNRDLVNLYSLTRILKEQRDIKGAININSREIRVKKGDETDFLLGNKTVNKSNSLIEECMILANRIVGEFIKERSTNWVLRKHEARDVDLSDTIRDEPVEDIADNVDKSDTPATTCAIENENVKNMLLTRSMKKAVYTNNFPLRHTGLAIDYYTHFTSPIRRYPDLIVHRILKSILYKIKYEIEDDNSIRHLNKKSRLAQVVSRECNREWVYRWLRQETGHSENEESGNEKLRHQVKRNHISKPGTQKISKDPFIFTGHVIKIISSEKSQFLLIYLEELDIDGIVQAPVTQEFNEKDALKVKFVKDDYWWRVMGFIKFTIN